MHTEFGIQTDDNDSTPRIILEFNETLTSILTIGLRA